MTWHRGSRCVVWQWEWNGLTPRGFRRSSLFWQLHWVHQRRWNKRGDGEHRENSAICILKSRWENTREEESNRPNFTPFKLLHENCPPPCRNHPMRLPWAPFRRCQATAASVWFTRMAKQLGGNSSLLRLSSISSSSLRVWRMNEVWRKGS